VPKFANTGSTAQAELALTFNSALTYYDPTGAPQPQLARQLPTQANGDWSVNADGTMVTTYRLRKRAQWHDGTALTARDFAFAYQVYSDPEVAVARREPESLMAGVEPEDDHTLVIRWKQPYYGAAALRFQQLDPLPSHLLAEKYPADRAGFVLGSEWTTGFVGAGPFRLDRWELGTMLLAQAFQNWALGPPRVATLEVRFMNDPNAIVASLLAGNLDVSGNPWVAGVHAASARERWGSGGVVLASESRLQHMDFSTGRSRTGNRR
jgi:peptide/nickel transport system substrate-binding protein